MSKRNVINITGLAECAGGNLIYGKRDLSYGKRDLSYGKRDLLIWQKRPIDMAKETYGCFFSRIHDPLSLSLFLVLSLSVCLARSLSLPLSFSHSVSLSRSLPLSISLSRARALSLFVCVCVCVCVCLPGGTVSAVVVFESDEDAQRFAGMLDPGLSAYLSYGIICMMM